MVENTKLTLSIYDNVNLLEDIDLLTANTPSICLNMIVKNESRIICRLLESVIDIIDTYCICDTGSTDNTVEIITNFCNEHNIKGIIFHEPFKNFGYNRTISLQYARTLGNNYILFLDADMKIEISSKFNKQMLVEKGYQVMQKNNSIQYYNLRLIHSSINTTCIGVTHEYYDVNNAKICKLDPNLMIINDIGDGGSKNNKLERDIILLKEGLKDIEKKTDSFNIGLRQRYLFYLANTYLDSGINDSAISTYKLRIDAGGWNEEVFYAYLKLGNAYKNIEQNEKAICAWLDGYNLYPKRAETLYEIIKYYRICGKNLLSWQFYLIAKNISFPKDDILFINYGIYEYLLDYEASIIIYYIPENNRFGYNPSSIITKILKHDRCNDYWNNILSNYKFYYPKLNNLKSCIIKNYTSSHNMNIGGNDYIMNSSSPCIFRWNNKWYMNIRFVNYTINKQNGGYNFNHDKIISANELVEFDNNWNIIAKKMFDIIYIDNDKYQGIEDCKVYICPDGIPRFIGTMWNDKLTIGYGIYPINNIDNKLLEYLPCRSPNNAICEKNWVMIDDKIIYKWHPLTIGHMEKDNNMWNFKQDKIINTHWLFSHIRGSSNAFWNSDKKEWWIMVHLVEYNNPRMYYHMFVILNEDKNIKKWSKIFKFDDDKIEYCIGLVIYNNKLILSYSEWDQSSKLGFYSLDEIEKEIW